MVSYVSESEKFVWYNNAGKVTVINIQKDKYKIPDTATPVLLDKNIYLLDPCNYDTKTKDFVPQGPAFSVATDGKIK